jgi:glycerate 2-kinase
VRILIVPDSFKESLTAMQVANAIEGGILNYRPGEECIKMPLADGGEGTVEAIIATLGGHKVKVIIKDPLMRDIESYYGLLPDNKTAVIEMAAASGLELLSKEERNPMLTSTFGTGQLIRSALDQGCKRIYLGIGGSATNDGGAGMARALGVRFLNTEGREIKNSGRHLLEISHIDLSSLDYRIHRCEVVVLSDVNNPLCGQNGASYVYGPQKGANQDMVKLLDQCLLYFGGLLENTFEKEIINVSGAGAAGGLGAGLLAFCNASLKPGFSTIADILQLEHRIREADLIITGEGKIDYQTKFGKVPFGVAQLAKKYHKPVIGMAGMLGEGYQELYEFGFQSLVPISEQPGSLESSIKNASNLIFNTAERIIRLIYIGIDNK